jgi:hypothetical protein
VKSCFRNFCFIIIVVVVVVVVAAVVAFSGFHISVTEDSGPLACDAALLCSYLHYFAYYYKMESDFSHFKSVQTDSGVVTKRPPPPTQSV